jgi:hypothetical protein
MPSCMRRSYRRLLAVTVSTGWWVHRARSLTSAKKVSSVYFNRATSRNPVELLAVHMSGCLHRRFYTLYCQAAGIARMLFVNVCSWSRKMWIGEEEEVDAKKKRGPNQRWSCS